MAKATGKLRQDSIYHITKEQGYRSRAAIKLLKLDRSFRFLPTARAVLDLGAAPGGWLQVAVRGTTAGAFVVGVDVARIRPIRGAISLTEDITATARCSAAVRKLMDSKGVAAFDVVLHDGVGENKKRKRDGEETTRQSALVIDAIHLATMFLAPKGTFITKFVGSQDFKATMFCLKQLFEKVRVSKPMASRSTLPERYFVCLEYKAPAVIQPELFDLEHLLTLSLENKPGDEVRTPMEIKPRQGGTSTGVQPGDEFRTPMEIKPRQGVTIYGSFPSWKACCTGRASDFIWSEAQTLKELLGSFMGVSFDDPSSLLIKNHELTTDEIQGFCRHLDILDEKTLKHIWEWRTRLRKALSSSSQVTPKPDVTAVDASVKDDGQLVAKTEEFMSIIGRKTRREKHQSSCRAKEKAHKTTGMQIDAIEDGYCNADLLSVCAIKHGKELRAIGSAGLDMEDGIGDGGKEETQTHGGYNQEMDPDEERHRYEGMLDEAHKGFIITNGEVKQQRKHMNAINPYAKADLLEERKEKALAKNQIHVKKYTGNPYWWIDG